MSARRAIRDVAAKGFERGATDYERSRPSYPAGVIATLERECGLGPSATVVDLAAGTGKFTRLLGATGATVIAVEPVAAMRAAFARALGGHVIVEGTAEEIPLPDQSADMVTVAQAFHWFEAVAALDEIARVVRSGGWLALVWNTRHERSPWALQLTAILDRLAADAPRFRSSDERWRAAIDDHSAFGPLQSAAFDNPVEVDLELMLARVASTSYVSALSEDGRAAVLAEVTALLKRGPMAEHGPTFVDQYRTELFWCRRA